MTANAPMSSAAAGRPPGMTDTSTTTPTTPPTTVTSLGVAMFTVADQDAALAFYTEKLGYEVRGDARFGEHGEHRWLEVAPPGSLARLALNPPMGGQPGGGGIGVETPDVLAEHRRLSALGVDVDPEPMRTPGAPLLFMMRDPDGNHIAVVEAPPAS
jgi:lactoylglutathione lyase